MKKLLLGLCVLVVAIAAYMAGRWMEGAKSGYHYQVLEDTEIKSDWGPIHSKTVMEYVGFPFVEPETTLIEVDGRTIYKAKRIFQERYPSARNVRVNGGLIEWEDGEYSFSLRMEKMPPAKETGTGTVPATDPHESR